MENKIGRRGVRRLRRGQRTTRRLGNRGGELLDQSLFGLVFHGHLLRSE
jgi:hypothetical protein